MTDSAHKILKQVLAAGFDQAKVSISERELNELNIAHNQVSLMRSGSTQTLSLVGIQNQRKVTASVSGIEPDVVRAVVDGMVRDVAATPADDANAVAPDQNGSFTQGPQNVDRDALAKVTKDFLAYRSKRYPTFQVEEASIQHSINRSTVLTSRNSELALSHGSYGVSIMGSSKDEHGSSSFNYSGGEMAELPSALQDQFDIDLLMEHSVQETKTEPVGSKFIGEVVLMPNAVGDLLGWLQGQLGDFALLQDSSVYKASVGEAIASSLLTIRHVTQGAGVSPFNGDGFLLEPFTLVEHGKLNCLLPSYYGSRKLNLPHQPCGRGWEVVPGNSSKADMISSVEKGALVGRLSMGRPAPNGDFSGVIKNSFLIEGGSRTKALSETMIMGNVAQMLKEILAISSEATDFGSGKIPWIKIGGLHFSS